MPAGDRTGPLGQGPRTSGFCSGFNTPGYVTSFGGGMGRGFGRGIGRGMGRGRGFGRNWNPGNVASGFNQGFPWGSSITKEDEIKVLKSQSEFLKRSQKEIERRLKEIESEGE